MVKFVPLNATEHGNKSWIRTLGYSFSSRDTLVPVVGGELGAAVCEMPLGFVRENNEFTLVAILSFKNGINFYVDGEGRWLGGHVPFILRSYPFRLLHPEGSSELLLCVDAESDCIKEGDGGDPLFDAGSTPSNSVLQILEALKRYEAARIATNAAVAALAETKVIVPWSIKVVGGVSEASVGGIYRIDETILNQLGDEAFLKLKSAHALSIAYAQLFSTQQIGRLGKLANIHDQLEFQAAERQRTLAEMFRLDDGTIPL